MATAPTAAQPVDVGIVVALQDKEVHDLHAAVLAAGLSASRAALMATIDAGFVAGIPTAANLRDQILVDLDALNRTGALADGTVPLRTWLANAEHLAGKQREAAIFARCLARLAAAAPAASSSGPDVHIGRLPSTGRDLFGREADLAWLDACWDEGVRVVSIVAYGGMGKSSLVNGWLRRMDGAGWRGATRVYGWSFYSQGTDRLASSDAFFSEALRWFGDTEAAPTSPWEKGERLAALVRKERALLILDGVEPLQWGPGEQEGKLKDPALLALVKDLGSDNMGLCTTTSRIALTDMEGVGGDRVREKKLNKLSEEAGAQLLGARGAKGTEEELREAAGEYKGHGLALTLLGSYLADVAGGDIRRRTEIGLLERDERVGEHARRVMTAYEQWLGKPEVTILHMIGLFDQPADEDEIVALLFGEVLAGEVEGGWRRSCGGERASMPT